MHNTRPTIRDVAHDAGVSKTSVSRYFGSERNLLSENMQRRIAQSIARLDFRPDRMAASLRGGQTRLIGALVADIRNPYSVALVHAAERACEAAGYSLLVCNTDNDEQLEQRHLQVLDGYGVDGLIVNTSNPHAEALQAVCHRGIPTVLVDRQITALDCDMIGLDNADAIQQSVLHLVTQGYEQLALFIEPINGISSRQARVENFRAMCRQYGCRFAVQEWPAERAAGAAMDAELSRLAPCAKATAIIGGNGVMTLAICQSLQRINGFTSLGVLGIDELEWCALAGPGITTLAQPVDTIGRQAIQQLLARIAGSTQPPAMQKLTGRLIVRGSTRPNSAP